LSQTGSFGWDVGSDELYWSDETYRIFGLDRTTSPTFVLLIERTHPDDRLQFQDIVHQALRHRSSFAVEHRVVMSDGRVKFLHTVVRRLAVVFLGAVSDVTERKRAEKERQRLRQNGAGDRAHKPSEHDGRTGCIARA